MYLDVAIITGLWQSHAFHLALSIVLHIFGICTGLWIWYIFPQNPTKNVTRMPQRKPSDVRTLMPDSSDSEEESESAADARTDLEESDRIPLNFVSGAKQNSHNRRFG
ncbi:hypothetical protein DdX_09790 [Ditylenchus destructor]|uniref:Uncharacterized protein n=1 Tax=Ditylenchus destructor TaxID=166010 RepID=A0AAD4N2C2_9BILA|nr:hypothetical protein DdX_09790 [Ditylenchus destructor]